jgi:hypothetical protein
MPGWARGYAGPTRTSHYQPSDDGQCDAKPSGFGITNGGPVPHKPMLHNHADEIRLKAGGLAG